MNISDKVLSEVRGILWITENPLNHLPSGTEELDHLFDGLIHHHIANHKIIDATIEKNIFTCSSFGRDLVLIQLWSNDQKLIEQEIAKCLALVPGKSDHPSVLVIDKQNTNRTKNLSSKNKEFHFEAIDD